ncbi:uncharacterized protein LOC117088405 [Trachypithecus francoisi]|uniref:uncharacterized protein LOC117088405 n=1 Tax=Trachypithecus francoisi TaxID=54180 RepID=UPI00141AFD99|nr:uncharacterized protein LOC117088405 [Trachypithecus francoisi]
MQTRGAGIPSPGWSAIWNLTRLKQHYGGFGAGPSTQSSGRQEVHTALRPNCLTILTSMDRAQVRAISEPPPSSPTASALLSALSPPGLSSSCPFPVGVSHTGSPKHSAFTSPQGSAHPYSVSPYPIPNPEIFRCVPGNSQPMISKTSTSCLRCSCTSQLQRCLCLPEDVAPSKVLPHGGVSTGTLYPWPRGGVASSLLTVVLQPFCLLHP